MTDLVDTLFLTVMKNPVFNSVMSREAKLLRNDVLKLCLQHAGVGSDFTTFVDKMIQQYSSIPWERTILFISAKSANNAVLRRTSASFYDEKKSENKVSWERGSISGKRYKDIDWLEIANFDFSLEWWLSAVDFCRNGGIYPNIFDRSRDRFVEMYELFTRWFFTDFSTKALGYIFKFSIEHSTDFIANCMKSVEDRSKRSIEYLIPIVEKERALIQIESKERADIDRQSRESLSVLIDIATSKTQPVNWDNIDNSIQIDTINSESFDKIKLS